MRIKYHFYFGNEIRQLLLLIFLVNIIYPPFNTIENQLYTEIGNELSP